MILSNGFPIREGSFVAFVLTVALTKDVVSAGPQNVSKTTQIARTLIEGCEVPTHSSINLQQGRWPWNVQIFQARFGDAFSMASNLASPRTVEGTLISRRHVLTTSIDIGPHWEQLKVRFRTNAGVDLEVEVSQRFVFNSTGRLGDNNLAILELAETIKTPKFPEEIRPLCILSPGVVSNKTNGELVPMLPTMSAFTNSQTNHLCQMNVKFIPDEQCSQELETLTGQRVSYESYICDDLDKCNDLVGSTVMVQENDHDFQVVGMLSFVYNHFAPEAIYPSLFQRILPRHTAWIEAVLRNAE